MAPFPAFPEHIPERFAAAWNAKDPDDIGALFAEDADFVNVVGLWWRRKQRIWKAHEIGLRTFFRDSTLTIEQTEVKYITDAVATAHARWTIRGQYAPDGTTAGDRQGIFLFVAHQQADGWICVAAHNTDLLPGKESIVIDEAGRAEGAAYTISTAE
ncbi:MAG: SgcJ/EcaC family oxidoreductase [Bacteroidetes bacterium]|jgi:uncharacterized protein (TIGR02246 family)|nr:SgcJ/EcaC family oxidoreductase [Bacteroidota bacterium]